MRVWKNYIFVSGDNNSIKCIDLVMYICKDEKEIILGNFFDDFDVIDLGRFIYVDW